jgi:ABC-2 type transport system permease protein
MNMQSNAIAGSSIDSPDVAPRMMSPTRPEFWSIRRELWENRWIYIAPLTVAAIFLFGFLVSTVTLPRKIRSLPALDLAHQHQVVVSPFDTAAALIMATALLVGVFYSLDALHGERRDRSILFWKSLPVSDVTTVLAKASIPIVILQLLSFAIVVVTQLIMMLFSSVVLLVNGLNPATLWMQFPLFQLSLMLLYHLVTVHMLWHAPIYAWLLLVSAWARRAAFLWAFLPPLAIAALEKMLFNTSHFVAMLGNRLSGGPEGMGMPGTFPIDVGMHLTLGRFLISPGLWIGLVIAAACLAGAVRLRHCRGPL